MRKKTLTILILLIAGCSILNRRSEKRVPAAAKHWVVEPSYPSEKEYAAFFESTQYKSPNEVLTYKKFLAEIRDLKTVETALAHLRDKYPRFMSNYTLMFRSKSIQESSWSNPRAIVFGADARFIVTFNGQTSQMGGGEFETMEFDEINKRFLFREIIFRGQTPPHDILLEPQEIASQSPNLIISKPNPHKCTLCHGEKDAHPVWAEYPIWPGAYGGEDDYPFNFGELAKKERSYLVRYFARPPEDDREIKELKNFNEVKDSTDRYKYLLPQESYSDAYRSTATSRRTTPNLKMCDVDTSRLLA